MFPYRVFSEKVVWVCSFTSFYASVYFYIVSERDTNISLPFCSAEMNLKSEGSGSKSQ